MVNVGVLFLAQLLGVGQSRKNEPIQTPHGGGGVSDVLALLHLEVVAILVERLSRLDFLSGRRVVELGPEIGVGEDGIGAFKGGYERFLVVQVAFDHFDALGGPGLGFGWVPGYASDIPAGFLGVETGHGATLRDLASWSDKRCRVAVCVLAGQ